jgi:predicted nucleic acid-binding Zn ribbon protein
MQKVSEETLKICEKCGGKLEKQWSLSGFQFKGEGWYVTDYAGKKGKEAEKSEKSEKSEKTSASDSTEKPKTASKEKSDSSSSPKKDTVSKKE